MATKITVNGVTYDSLDALPPEARRMYEQALENMPEIGDRNRDGIPDILDLRSGPISHRTVVRKKFVVNGQSYDDESAMPPDARAAFDQAKQRLASGDPTIKKNEIHLSFSVTGPGGTWRKTFGTPPVTAQDAAPSPRSERSLMPTPIEPPPVESRIRFVIIAGSCAAAGLLFWLFTHAR